jgi:hypothetical protein
MMIVVSRDHYMKPHLVTRGVEGSMRKRETLIDNKTTYRDPINAGIGEGTYRT